MSSLANTSMKDFAFHGSISRPWIGDCRTTRCHSCLILLGNGAEWPTSGTWVLCLPLISVGGSQRTIIAGSDHDLP